MYHNAAFAIVGMGLLVWLFVIVNGWRNDSIALETERIAHAAEVVRLHEQLNVEIENRRKADEAALRHQSRVDDLENDRLSDPFPTVRVCNSPPRVPAAPASGAAAVAHETVEANDQGEDEGNRDIGPELERFATDAELNLIQCEELQEWVRNR